MQINVGDILEGKVTGITGFGVFVDLGEGNTGMVHISEVSRNYITDIKEILKVNDTVKVKVVNIGEDNKISLSIKRAEEKKRKTFSNPPAVDNSFVWTETRNEGSFEDMLSKFKQTSDEKFSMLKRKNADTRRSKRGQQR